MTKHLFLLLMTCPLFAAEDPWSKVRDLKSGTEIRVYKTGSKTPVIAKIDEANEGRLVLVIKDTQTAIPKEEIERVDARPAQSGSRVRTESQTKTTNPDIKPSTPGLAQQAASTPSRSTSSELSVGSKPGFETIYRRTASKTSSK